jgi:hypothetical protein
VEKIYRRFRLPGPDASLAAALQEASLHTETHVSDTDTVLKDFGLDESELRGGWRRFFRPFPILRKPMHLSLSTMIFSFIFRRVAGRSFWPGWPKQGFRCVEYHRRTKPFSLVRRRTVRQLAGWFAKHSIRPLTFHLPFRTRMQSLIFIT